MSLLFTILGFSGGILGLYTGYALGQGVHLRTIYWYTLIASVLCLASTIYFWNLSMTVIQSIWIVISVYNLARGAK